LIVTVLFVGQVYLAAIYVPAGTRYAGASADTAFYTLSADIVGAWFLPIVTLTSGVVGLLSNALVSQATTARVLFSMARDGHRPAPLGRVNPRTQVPSLAIMAVAMASLFIAFAGVAYLDVMVTLVTFGALTAYILLHVAVISHFHRKGGAGLFRHRISPLIGIALLSYALWTTNVNAKILGVIWMAGGVLVSVRLRRRDRSRARMAAGTMADESTVPR
jgi:amino acid transporter